MGSEWSEHRSVVSDSLRPHGLYSPWKSPGQNAGWVDFPSPGDLPNPGTEPRSPTRQADSLSAEPPGRPITGKSQPLKGSVHLFCLFFSQMGRVRSPLYEPSKGILVCIQAEGQYPLRQVIVCNDDSGEGKQADEAATTCSPNWCSSARAVGHGLHRAASGLSCPVACGILEIRPMAPAFFTAFSTTVPSGKPHEYTFWDLTFSTQCFSKGIMFSDLQTRWQVPLFLMEHV